MNTVPTTPSRDEGSWASHQGPLSVQDAPAEARNRNVDGRELAGPMQGFGKMWQKTYRVALPGVDLSPAALIEEWKEHYGEFWPEGNRFHAPLAGIKPGEVGLIDADMPGRVTLSTGVMVLYSDETSFAFMTPQGHPFAGWITFSAEEVSAEEADGVVHAQVEVLIRAQDILTEIGMMLGGHRTEDRMWEGTLTNLAAHVGVPDADVTTSVVCVDRRRQWRRLGNVRHDAALHEAAHLARAPARVSGGSWTRLVTSAGVALAVTQIAFQAVAGEVIPPLAVFALLGLVVAAVVQRWRRAGGVGAVVLAVLMTAGGGPFLVDALPHPESPVDFLHATWTLIALVALLIGGVAVLRRRQGFPVRLAGGTALAAAATLLISLVASASAGSTVPVDAGAVVRASGALWETSAIEVSAGGDVALDNGDPLRHTFTVEGTGIDVEMPAGRVRTAAIDLAPGTYRFFCAVPGHEAMTGSLIVR